ncbi:uncharacterized protein LOC144158984 [Haemaphysalis longicornis]
MSDAGNSAGDSEFYGYFLVGFNSFLDFRTIEFRERLPDAHVCDNCGAVSGEVQLLLPCMHVSCSRCVVRKMQNGCYYITCAVDNTASRNNSEWNNVKDVLYRKAVRCPNTSFGCNHTCTLKDLETHFPVCQFSKTVCSICGIPIQFGQLAHHYAGCRAIFFSVAAAFTKSKQLLEDLTNAKKEVEEVVAGNPSDEGALRRKVNSMLDVLQRLQIQVPNTDA